MNDSSPENQITYDCHYLMPEFSFQNSDTVSPIAAYAVTCLACPFIIVLNTLIIVVVAKNITLQSNTNILFSSMAAADLLVGVVVQPLTILSGAIFFRDHSESGIYCILDAITIVISTGTSMCSIFHLTAIAWQRHAIINLNLINNQATISRRRIKILASLSWMSAVISSIPSAMILNGLNFKNATYLDTLVFLLVVICWILIAYCYILIYIKTRKIKIEPANQNITQIAKVKMEKGIAHTTGLLTLVVFLCYAPNLIFPLCYLSSTFCGSSYLLWGLTLTQLNSLANPVLYCYRSRQLRKATLELLGIETWEIPLNFLHGRIDRVQPNNMPLRDPQLALALPQGERARERSKSWSPNNFNNIRLAVHKGQFAET